MNVRFRKQFYQNPLGPDGTDLPGSTETIDTPQVETVAAPPPPASMLDAISAGLDSGLDAAGQPRDELGRFAAKQAEAAAAAAVAAGAPPVAAAPAAPVPPAVQLTPEEELLQMPENLTPKAQERFQKLANTVKDVSAERDEYKSTFESFQTVLRQNGVQQEQFGQAVEALGMLNRGDLAGYQRMLTQELRAISLRTGQPAQMVDPLESFPDLRQAVDGLQISEAQAMEMARLRSFEQSAQANQQRQQQAQQQQRQEQEQQQQAEQARQGALLKVDAFCKQLQATDMDYPAIEAKLLPVLPQLLEGVPPERWENAVRTQYHLLKQMAGSVRQPVAALPGQQPLRATGQASPAAAPKSMFDAINAHLG